jgi:uncharacterized protein (DUF58 family)
VKPWVKYSIIRIGLFAVLLLVFLLLGIPGWISALLAAIVGLCVAYIFFRPLRDATVSSVAARRSAPALASDDESAEDAAIDNDER